MSIKNIIGKINKKNVVSALTHVVCVSIIVLLPELVTFLYEGRPAPGGVYVKILIFLSIFYINYFFIIDKCLDKKGGRWQFFISNLLILCVAAVLIYFSSNAYRRPHPPHSRHVPDIEHVNHSTEKATQFAPSKNAPPPPPPQRVYDRFIKGNRNLIPERNLLRIAANMSHDLVFAILVVGLSFAIKISRRWLNSELKRVKLDSMQREVELVSLKNQLNPHFLFNTLNTIYALVSTEPPKAQDAIHKLSNMLRYGLYETSSVVPIKKELDFIKTYCDFMKMRISKTKIEVSLYCDDAGREIYIAPLLLIPIIENVFKYGNTGQSDHLIKVDVSVKNAVLRCYTFNNLDKGRKSTDASGIGLNNLRRRLELLYGNKSKFNIIIQDDSCQTELIINIGC